MALENYLIAPPRRRSVEDELENNSGMMTMLKSYYRAEDEGDMELVSDKALLTVRRVQRYTTYILFVCGFALKIFGCF